MQAEYFALEGISELMSTLDRVAQAFNPDLALEGVLLTMYDDRTNLSQQVTDNLRGFFAKSSSRPLSRATSASPKPPATASPSPSTIPLPGAEAYRDLALEVLTRNNIESPEQKKRASPPPPRPPPPTRRSASGLIQNSAFHVIHVFHT